MTRVASPISDWTTMRAMGLLGTCRPFFRMLTTCSPTSRGMKEMPGGTTEQEAGEDETRIIKGLKEKEAGLLLPMWLLAILLSRQGSSRPDGARMLAVNTLRSLSWMSREKSAAEPSLT